MSVMRGRSHGPSMRQRTVDVVQVFTKAPKVDFVDATCTNLLSNRAHERELAGEARHLGPPECIPRRDVTAPRFVRMRMIAQHTYLFTLPDPEGGGELALQRAVQEGELKVGDAQPQGWERPRCFLGSARRRQSQALLGRRALARILIARVVSRKR